MLVSRRVRTVAAVGALAVAMGVLCGPADPPAQAAPRTFTIVGGGWGHGIGMSFPRSTSGGLELTAPRCLVGS